MFQRALWVAILLAPATMADLMPHAPAQPRDKSSTADVDPAAALKRIPLEQIAGPHRDRVVEILKKPLVFRQSRVQVFPINIDLLEWLVDHPAVVAEYWKQLGLEVSDVELLENGYCCRDGERAKVTFHVVIDSPELRMLYCIGEARHPLLPAPLVAELVMVQHYRVHRQTEGRSVIVQQMEGFATARGPALKLAMKLGKSTAQRAVDQCLEEMTIYFSVIGRIMEVRPEWSIGVLAQARPKYPNADFARLETILRKLPDPDGRDRWLAELAKNHSTTAKTPIVSAKNEMPAAPNDAQPSAAPAAGPSAGPSLRAIMRPVSEASPKPSQSKTSPP